MLVGGSELVAGIRKYLRLHQSRRHAGSGAECGKNIGSRWSYWSFRLAHQLSICTSDSGYRLTGITVISGRLAASTGGIVEAEGNFGCAASIRTVGQDVPELRYSGINAYDFLG